MANFPADPRAFSWRSSAFSGAFHPRGPLTRIGENVLRGGLSGSKKLPPGPAWAARLIVGFNVKGVPTWDVKHVIPIVKRVRLEQAPKDPGASFLHQLGIYQHKEDKKSFVEEDGVQVIILNLAGATEEAFIQQMIELGEALARELQQDEIIVEIQRNGLTQETHIVDPS